MSYDGHLKIIIKLYTYYLPILKLAKGEVRLLLEHVKALIACG